MRLGLKLMEDQFGQLGRENSTKEEGPEEAEAEKWVEVDVSAEDVTAIACSRWATILTLRK
jgi:hypothetical protein